MAGSWLKLECKMLLLGWSSELPAAEYAAWIKLLQVTKAFGERCGRIKSSYFDDSLLGKLNISRHAFDQTISKATKNGSVSLDGEYLVVTHWANYQIDPTAAKRKAKQRASGEENVTVTPVSHGCHDDRTGQDRTGQETEKIGAAAGNGKVTWDGSHFHLPQAMLSDIYPKYPMMTTADVHEEIKACAVYHRDNKTKINSPSGRIRTWLNNARKDYPGVVTNEAIIEIDGMKGTLAKWVDMVIGWRLPQAFPNYETQDEALRKAIEAHPQIWPAVMEREAK